ncbi:hypothetical protein MPTA5024_33660 [Microbispora sp. ATCC PTA-5024]|nr:hypothetical protein MPTA5024_33660 [Microbispora sp. ATCC PTA-5024]
MAHFNRMGLTALSTVFIAFAAPTAALAADDPGPVAAPAAGGGPTITRNTPAAAAQPAADPATAKGLVVQVLSLLSPKDVTTMSWQSLMKTFNLSKEAAQALFTIIALGDDPGMYQHIPEGCVELAMHTAWDLMDRWDPTAAEGGR